MFHDNNHVSIVKILPMMRAKDSGLVFKNTHDAVRENVRGHVGIDSSQWVVEEINVFVLNGGKH
jgi:hypothetical protein